MKYKYKQQISLGRSPEGKLVRKWIYSNSKSDLLAQKVKLQERYKNGGMPVSATFYEYAQAWLETFKANNSSATRSAYTRYVEQCSLLHSMKVESVTNSDCQKVINQYWQYPELCRKIALTMHQIFDQLNRDGMIQRNPADNLKLPKKTQKPKRVLTQDEKNAIKQLLKEDDDTLYPQKKMFLASLYYFGLRPEEARGLMADDFNFDSEEVTISRALAYDGEIGEIKGTKTENIRTIPIPTAAVTQFKSYCEALKSPYLFTKVTDGELLTQTAYRRMWASICFHINVLLGGSSKDKKISGLTPYVFRRNYATTLYYSGISLKKAAYLMGHADTKMITEVYAQIDDQQESLDILKNLL